MNVTYRPSNIRMLQKEPHRYIRDFCPELLLKPPWGRRWLLPIQLPTQYRSFFEIATRRETRTVVWTHVKWTDFNSVDSSRNLWPKPRVFWHSMCVIFRRWFDSRHKVKTLPSMPRPDHLWSPVYSSLDTRVQAGGT